MPQLQIYPTGRSDPQLVLAAMKLLMAGQSDVVLDIDIRTNNLLVSARPAQQAMIRAALAQLQHEGDRIEVIHLVRLDPQAAVQAINRLFPSGDATKGAPTGPQVDVDLGSRQLMIRGTELQISQIRGLLEKMGEIMPGESELAQGGRVRVLPLSGAAGMSAIKRIEEIWPTLRANKIVVEGAPTSILSEQPVADKPREATPKEHANPSPPLKLPDEQQQKLQSPGDKSSAPLPSPPGPSKPSPNDHSAGLRGGAESFMSLRNRRRKRPPSPSRRRPPRRLRPARNLRRASRLWPASRPQRASCRHQPSRPH